MFLAVLGLTNFILAQAQRNIQPEAQRIHGLQTGREFAHTVSNLIKIQDSKGNKSNA